MADVAPMAPGGGNTISPPGKRQKVENDQIRQEVRGSAAKNWCFTYNNYPENWLALMAPGLQGSAWIGGEEVGESGTPHIQGYIQFPKKVRPVGYKGMPKEIHWEKARGSKDENVAYCSKQAGTIHGNLKPKISMEIEEDDIMKYEDLFPWGQELVDMVGGCLPDKTDRRILWYWSKEGCMKKTETARYLVYHHDAIVVQGGRKHVLAVGYKNPAPIYILLVPRTDEGFVSYASIELLKDSLYMSAFGTEATAPVNRKKPWVIIMANFEPEMEALSIDRWVIQNVDKPKELPNIDGIGWKGIM
jgi:hypothetical protein